MPAAAAARDLAAVAAWTVLWAVAHNPTRKVGVLAGGFHARGDNRPGSALT